MELKTGKERVVVVVWLKSGHRIESAKSANISVPVHHNPNAIQFN